MARDLEVTWGLVINGHPVPAEHKRIAIMDPYHLAGEVPDPRSIGPVDTMDDRLLVNFKATGDVLWLEDALHLEHKTWKSLQRQIPFLQEIKGLVTSKREYHGGHARAPRQCQDGNINEKIK